MLPWGRPVCRCFLRRQHRWCLLLALAAALALPILVLTGIFEEHLSFFLAPFLRGSSGSALQRPVSGVDSYQIANSGACRGPDPPFLLCLVVSAPSHFQSRQAIRQTWGRTRELGGLGIRRLFVLGDPQAPEVQAQLEQESVEHKDLVQGTFHDTYRNLTLKTLMLLRWAGTFCPEALFLLKVDDDVFVNMKGLVDHLRGLGSARPEGIYLGRIHWGVRPIRDPTSRYYTSEAAFSGDRFPLYCSGTAYVVSRDVAWRVSAVALETPIVALEDVYMGICARKVGVAPQHSAWFSGSTQYPLDPFCYRCIFTSHRMTPTMMEKAWALLAPDREGGCSWLLGRLALVRCKLLSWLT
ncbi:beta-1,3-galactosyltransferase 4 [Rhinatrema bivittatum]|uniref:beta-1,3-galactosyltransferase 4 n=1 Tax=Rhinatrema bivittatum TaxID=194408 RepID=UPI00112AACD2|nr:beta-1,3-galactosyltransferase 4 [Rhinatrema bivittatum]